MKQRAFAIDKAPGKDLIDFVVSKKDINAFRSFYQVRRDWWRAPLIHDYFVTYDIFHDLRLTDEDKAFFFPISIEVAEKESDELFSCAVMLMRILSDGFSHVSDKEGCRARIVAMRDRARRLTHYPNMACFWNALIQECFVFYNHPLCISADDWKEFERAQ